MKYDIKNSKTGSIYNVDETASESDIRDAEPAFFRTPHGKRETTEMHRGFLIVRATIRLSGGFGRVGQDVRKTVVYIFNKGETAKESNTLCLGSDFTGAPQARRYIDRVIKEGQF